MSRVSAEELQRRRTRQVDRILHSMTQIFFASLAIAVLLYFATLFGLAAPWI